MIELVALNRQYQRYKLDIDRQIKEVLDSASFIMGAKVEELERLLSGYVGTKFAIGCSSGTDALLLALMAYGVGEDDEIITTPFTFISTAEVISFLKARVVFVDIDSQTFNIDPAKIEAAITEHTRGIIAVDIFGQCAEYDYINSIAAKYSLFVIEDAAQSFGAKYKGRRSCSLADVACTSFFPAKPFGCYGDGGMVFTDNEEIANVIYSLRGHGKGTHKYDNIRIGLNARLDTIQAAVLLAKFPYFQNELDGRNRIAEVYTERLKSKVMVPIIEGHNFSAFAQYCIRFEKRDDLHSYLKERGIHTAIFYPKPLHLQRAFAYLEYSLGDFPVAEEVSRDILALPIHPFLSLEEQDEIIEAILSF